MISLPPKLTPSQVLYREGLSPFIDDLLSNCRLLRGEGRLLEAERCALDAMEASQEANVRVNAGIALIHLADTHRDMDRLGPALADSEKGYRVFQTQPSYHQRHNEAVAAYALGLVHQMLGSELDALRWYQTSSNLFDRVKEHWASINALANVENCTRLQHWIATLSEYLTDTRTRTNSGFSTLIIPIILSDQDGGRFAIAEIGIDQYRVERELRINGKPFHTAPLRGKRRIFLQPGSEYYALEIPDDAREPLSAGERDLALIMREKSASREGPGVLETLIGAEFGTFERDETAGTRFVRSDAEVIGGKDIGQDLQVGYVAALLKPESERD